VVKAVLPLKVQTNQEVLVRKVMLLLVVGAIALFALTPVAFAANGSGGSFHYSGLGIDVNGGTGGSSTGSGGGFGETGAFLGVYPVHCGAGSGGSGSHSGGGGSC
jgi:hypothetical protein